MSLLAPALLQKLGRTRLRVRQAVASTGIGERRSRAKGAGMEFADHRVYQLGDDIRHLDQHVHARLGELHVKQFSVYQQLSVTILLDASASMAYGRPEKFGCAAALAAGLAYIALSGGDQVLVGAFSGEKLQWYSRLHGARRAAVLLGWLEGLRPHGDTDLSRTARGATPRLRRNGLLIVISDWMAEGAEEALAVFQGLRQEVVGIHVLAPDELEPEQVGFGDVRFVDAESDQEVEASLDAAAYQRYREALRAWSTELKDQLQQRQGTYLPVRSDDDPERLFLRDWRVQGLIR
jgi:uncharacterized protein (DUF58 family)